MEVKKISPRVSCFLQVKLDQAVVDYLWKIIDIGKTNNKNHKNKLVGNISQSLLLDDIDSFFYKSVCVPLIKYYRENNPISGDPVSENTLLKPGSKLILNNLWVNYQYKTEFNPSHDHSGVYSFAIWMKIPYSWEDQKKLPQFRNIRDGDIKAGCFEFEYIDSLGGILNSMYRLSSEYEGYMVFFPARLRHCVYPFYGSDEPRISVAGNLNYLPD
ncbi:putative 2OG-Fe(II) oxygenase [Prochlorococcus marinus]|uniref:putative 2OG-Fe(II) oxygenase n=1 Tax=Prochlorococcus marinus TaxID=1219 RepID=UPI0022B38A1D|nr:putative 2OG-Fe(II) oxygenase [Prochlorococcus marinus]